MRRDHSLRDRLPGRLPRNHRLPLLYRLLDAHAPDDAGQAALGRDARLAMVEAALLAADEPLTARRLATVAGLADATEARRLVERLRALYDQDGTAFQVEELAGGWQLLTRPEYHPWLVRLRRAAADARLTPALREALTIVAYRQPITRADLEAVRGVQSGDVLRQLMERGLVRIAGRDDSLGRPVLYATTKKFLQTFGLKSLHDLPPAEGVAPSKRKDEPEDEGQKKAAGPDLGVNT
ncbi:MAG TPA: SMC-Scp complex subunit ScpB [Gemmataceae bacterium]|nr:SMC-Scp complex subunit ScpB [Gemmataceae bacterium]